MYESSIGKNAHISSILSHLKEREGVSLVPSQVLLIDDDFDNRERAKEAGYCVLEMCGMDGFGLLSSLP